MTKAKEVKAHDATPVEVKAKEVLPAEAVATYAPTYVRPGNVEINGTPAELSIYVLGEQVGAEVVKMSARESWRVTPITFTGIEITSYTSNGEAQWVTKPDAVQHLLNDLKGL